MLNFVMVITFTNPPSLRPLLILFFSLDYGMHLFKSNQHGVPKFNPAQGVATNLKGMEEGMENSNRA